MIDRMLDVSMEDMVALGIGEGVRLWSYDGPTDEQAPSASTVTLASAARSGICIAWNGEMRSIRKWHLP